MQRGGSFTQLLAFASSLSSPSSPTSPAAASVPSTPASSDRQLRNSSSFSSLHSGGGGGGRTRSSSAETAPARRQVRSVRSLGNLLTKSMSSGNLLTKSVSQSRLNVNQKSAGSVSGLIIVDTHDVVARTRRLASSAGEAPGSVVGKHLGEFRAVKFRKGSYPGKIPLVLPTLARAFIAKGGIELKDKAWAQEHVDHLDIIKTKRDFELTGKVPDSADALLVAQLVVDFFDSLMPEDAPLSRLDSEEMSLMARFYTGSTDDDRQVDDCFSRVVTSIDEPQKSVFCWLIDFLATVSAGDPETTRQVADVFGPLVWARHYEIRLLSPEDVAQAELDAKVILYACIVFAKRSRRSSDKIIGNPTNE